MNGLDPKINTKKNCSKNISAVILKHGILRNQILEPTTGKT